MTSSVECSRGVRPRGEFRQHNIPAVAVALALLLHDRARFPSAMLDFHASARAVGGEFHLDLGRRFPLGSLPGERDEVRRAKSGDTADFELGTIGEALEESAADVDIYVT